MLWGTIDKTWIISLILLGKNWRELFEENYILFCNGDKKMKITYASQYSEEGTLSVYYWDSTIDSYALYYQATDAAIMGTVGVNTALDGKIYLQSHWGSGVKFSNINFSSSVPADWSTPTSTSYCQ
jgi:hypothetical protein